MRSIRTITTAVCTCAAAWAVAQVPLCVDPSFQAPYVSDVISSIDFMPNGQILVGGQVKPLGSISHLGWSRLNPDGSLDPDFDQNLGPVGSLVKVWDEDYFFATAGIGVHRCFLSSGTPDPSYQFPGLFFNSSGNAFHNFPDGKQWRTGWWIKRLYDEQGNQIGTQPGYGLIQRLPNGLADPDFDHKFTAPGWLTTIGETPDGRFLFGSTVGTEYEGRPVGRILRVWPDGQLDTSFHSTVNGGSPSSNYYFYPDGRILAFGNFQLPEYPGDTLAVIRLYPDGSTDASWPVIPFRISQAFFPALARIFNFHEIQPGKLILVGEFDTVEGQPAGAITAIDTAGNVLWDIFPGSDAGPLFFNGGNHRLLRGMKEGPDGALYIYGSYSGFDEGCNNHPEQRMITRLYPMNVGVEEAAPDGTLNVFPNPARDRLTIQWDNGPVGATLLVRILDVAGREVLSNSLHGLVHQLDISGLRGVYLVVVEADGVRHTERIIMD